MKNNWEPLLLWLNKKLAKNQTELVNKIDSIQNLFETSAEATASSADILEGQTAYNGTTLITGSMTNQGAKDATLLAGGSYAIPQGYHNGLGVVKAIDLASQTPGTAAADGILSGLKAWVAGKLIDGSMPDRQNTTVTAAAVSQDDEYTYFTIPERACYNTGSIVRSLNSNILNDLVRLVSYGAELGYSGTLSCSKTVTKAGLYVAVVSIHNTASAGTTSTASTASSGKKISEYNYNPSKWYASAIGVYQLNAGDTIQCSAQYSSSSYGTGSYAIFGPTGGIS